MEKQTSLNKNIALIGMPGCGKSTIGRLLSNMIHIPLIDVDEYIEKKENMNISEILLQGEDLFRGLELEAIKDIVKDFPLIISAGGGVVTIPKSMELLKKNSIVIFINRPIENILMDIDFKKRPLLKNSPDNLISLYEKRLPLYKKYCDIEILNSESIFQAVFSIIKIITAKESAH